MAISMTTSHEVMSSQLIFPMSFISLHLLQLFFNIGFAYTPYTLQHKSVSLRKSCCAKIIFGAQIHVSKIIPFYLVYRSMPILVENTFAEKREISLVMAFYTISLQMFDLMTLLKLFEQFLLAFITIRTVTCIAKTLQLRVLEVQYNVSVLNADHLSFFL